MREWLAGIVGESLAPIVTVILAAVVVILLALVLIGLAKRVFAGTGGIGSRTRAPRLAVVDVTSVDPKRKLVLVRRDEVEHLILIGGQNDLMIEQGILRGQPARRVRSDQPARQEPGFARGEATEHPPQAPMPQRRVPQVLPPAPAAAPPASPPSSPPTPPTLPTPSATVPVRPPERAVPTSPTAPIPRVEPQVASAGVRAPSGPRSSPTLQADDRAERVAVSPRRGPETGDRPAGEAPVVSPAIPELVRRRETVSVAPPLPSPPVPKVSAPEPVVPEPLPPLPQRTGDRSGPMRSAPVDAANVVAPQVEETPEIQSGASLPQQPPPVQPVSVAESLQISAPPAAPIVQPRSMATPTLPSAPRTQPVLPASQPTSTPARSLWSAPPTVTVGPVDRPQDSRLDSRDTATASTEPSRPVESEGRSGPSAPEAVPPTSEAPSSAEREPDIRSEEFPSVEPRQPLSVRSFATTIQARRNPVVALEKSPADTVSTPGADYGNQAPEVSPVRRDEPPQPVASPDDQEVPASTEASREPRPLTLEEEMERLLHDFTIDVSERR